MYSFTYFTPTKIYFGRGALLRLTDALKERGVKRVLLHYGGVSAIASGLIEKARVAIAEAGAQCVELGGVKPNPRLSLVREGIEKCLKGGVDFILALGGGSVIDSAKAIGLGVAEGGDVWDFYCGKRKPTRTLPVGVVLTNAAAGSETSPSSVITDEERGVKRGCTAEVTRPVFAVMEPELTFSVPPYVTACGCADIFMHTAERYLSGAPALKVTDGIAESILKTVVSASKTAVRKPDDFEARANLLWAGSLSHNGLTGLGGDGGDWSTHALGHELSARYDIAHGASLTAVWGSWARYVYKDCLSRFHTFAMHAMGVRPSGTREEIALKGIETAEEWFKSLGLPTSLSELGVEVGDQDIAAMARGCAANCGGKKGSCKVLKEADMLAIYTAAKTN